MAAMAPFRPLLPIPWVKRLRDSPATITVINPTTASIVAQLRPGVNPYPTLLLAAKAIVGTSRNAQSIPNETSFIFIVIALLFTASLHNKCRELMQIFLSLHEFI
jgi:hypothetical protein